MMFSVDSEGRLADWNAEAEHQLGFVQREVLGESFLEFIVYPFRELVGNMMATARNGAASKPVRMPFFSKDGDPIDVSLSATPCNVNAECMGHLALECTLMKDSTIPSHERDDVHVNTDAHEPHAQNLHENGEMASPAALFTVDDRGCVAEWNEQAEQLTLFLHDEVMGLRFLDFLTSNFRKAVAEMIHQVASTRAVRRLHLPFYTKAGEKLDILLRAYSGHSGNVVLEGHLVE
eukprot:TRINITY_DN49236_c0_g1_i1.p1 TRINITY_DN49236_c0_g1~~TRINITY_DN49236_c0_g1_i1.p1  ORF type:complete len:234 (-),score=44.33 TRINITY_DN49236_c0_g1_i1:356-1057(-)